MSSVVHRPTKGLTEIRPVSKCSTLSTGKAELKCSSTFVTNTAQNHWKSVFHLCPLLRMLKEGLWQLKKAGGDSWLLDSDWLSTGHYKHSGSEPMDRRSSYLCLFISVHLSIKINQSLNRKENKGSFYKLKNKELIRCKRYSLS